MPGIPPGPIPAAPVTWVGSPGHHDGPVISGGGEDAEVAALPWLVVVALGSTYMVLPGTVVVVVT